MNYQFFRSDELNEATFKAYIQAFNEIFEKDFTEAFFRNKYQKVAKGYSYHSFMLHEDKVVGACTFIPYEYAYFGKMLTFGLGVDVFVMPEFRKNPMALYQMYNQVKEAMQADDVSFSFAIPNKNAYPFWTKILKWQEISELPYYVLPVRFGKVLNKTTALDGLTSFSMKALNMVSQMGAVAVNTSSKLPPIHLNRQQINLEEHRFFGDYKRYPHFTYKIYDEDGIRTAYLIDFHNAAGEKDSRTLGKAVATILREDKVDLIIFVGEIDFIQGSLFKLPKSREPKKLPFIGEILNENDVKEDIWQYKNWEMGLFNYDVR